jgi:hypothetical protein
LGSLLAGITFYLVCFSLRLGLIPKSGLEQVLIEELVDHLYQPDNLNLLPAELHALTANA